MKTIFYRKFSVMITVFFMMFVMTTGLSIAADMEKTDRENQVGVENEPTDAIKENEQTGVVRENEQTGAVNQTDETWGENVIGDQESAAVMVDKASAVLKEAVSRTEGGISSSELKNAAGLMIIPDVVRASFIAGGRHGTGVLITRDQNEWGLPVFASVTGGSLGAQIGVESTDLVMVFQKEENVKQLLEGNELTLGVDASVAAGSSGKTVQASTSEADVISYQRTEGLFAGVSLTGSVITLDNESLMAYYNLSEEGEEARGYYGKEEMARKIGGFGKDKDTDLVKNIPQSAKQLQDTLKTSIE